MMTEETVQQTDSLSARSASESNLSPDSTATESSVANNVEPAPRSFKMPNDSSLQMAIIFKESGIVSRDQVERAIRIRNKLGEGYSLTKVILELGYLDNQQLRQILRDHRQTVPLGNLLVELGHLKPAELRVALEAQREPEFHGKRLGEVLLEMGLIQEHRLIDVLADQLDFIHEEPNFSDIDRAVLAKINPDWCKQLQAIPIRHQDDGVLVVFRNPMDSSARQSAEAAFQTVIPAISTRRALEDAIKAFESSLQHVKQRLPEIDEANVTRLADSLIIDALEAGASDLHIEPSRTVIRVRFRCDGVLILHKELDKDISSTLISRLKILSKADVTEKRRHQDGGFHFNDPRTGVACDVRASFFVTIFGEKAVLRLLSRKADLLDIRESGLAPRQLEHFLEDGLGVPSGIVLVTGPTGSGKTTTLYGCVNHLNDTERCIVTAEDPVEYVIDGIAQCSLNPKINLTFEETLRHMVRQDPDVIVIGEIRDRFSAESAIQAALTGHKVLSTFHTEDSIGCLLRLANMNIEPFLIASTVVAILAQRLLRRICKQCAEPYRPTAHELHRLGWTPSDLVNTNFQMGRGCRACHFTGYTGRVGIFETLILNDAVKDAVARRMSSSEIRRISIESAGLVILLEDGLVKAAHGETTLYEVFRHLPRLGKPRSLFEISRLLGN
jgi:type IV pilus assembly protein PilB